MSISEAADTHAGETEFETWLKAAYAETGGFTALTLVVKIGRRKVTPLSSTFFHVIGADFSWSDMVQLLAGSGVAWDGVAFFSTKAEAGGPLDNAMARLRLRMLETRVEDDRLALNEGHFFDAFGRRLRIEETPS